MTYEIVGIGNPLLDVTISIEDKILIQNNLTKGHMHLIDEITFKNLLNSLKKENMIEGLGGSVANTLASANSIGAKTLFLGSIGKDTFGQEYEKLTNESGIGCGFVSQNTPQGMCLVLITEDGERTFATYLGAAVELSDSDLTSEQFKDYKYLHIEGYLVLNHNLMLRAAELAKANNMKISIDMASFNVVEENLDFLKNQSYRRSHYSYQCQIQNEIIDVFHKFLRILQRTQTLFLFRFRLSDLLQKEQRYVLLWKDPGLYRPPFLTGIYPPGKTFQKVCHGFLHLCLCLRLLRL